MYINVYIFPLPLLPSPPPPPLPPPPPASFFMQLASNLVCESLVAYRLRIYINVDIFPPPPPLPPPPPPPPPLPPQAS